MLIDEFLPDYQFVERHGRMVGAPAARVEQAVFALNAADSVVIRVLLALRGMSCESLNFGSLEGTGFRVLGRVPARELAIGLIGRFWTAGGDLQAFEPAGFRDFARSGYAKAVWNFSLEEVSPTSTMLRTETRVWCPEERTQRIFARYWRLIRPFSGLIRSEMLRLIQRSSEATAGPAARIR